MILSIYKCGNVKYCISSLSVYSVFIYAIIHVVYVFLSHLQKIKMLSFRNKQLCRAVFYSYCANRSISDSQGLLPQASLLSTPHFISLLEYKRHRKLWYFHHLWQDYCSFLSVPGGAEGGWRGLNLSLFLRHTALVQTNKRAALNGTCSRRQSPVS